MALSKAEKLAYDEHLNAVMIQNDVISTNRMEARAEGRAEGLAEGLEKGRAEGLNEGVQKGRAEQARSIARSLKAAGLADEFIVAHTGLPLTDIEGLD